MSVAGIGFLENSTNSNYILFPNPTSDNVTLDFGNMVENATISIYDVTGKLVYTINNLSGNLFQLSTSQLSKGAYIVNIQTKDSNTSVQLIKK